MQTIEDCNLNSQCPSCPLKAQCESLIKQCEQNPQCKSLIEECELQEQCGSSIENDENQFIKGKICDTRSSIELKEQCGSSIENCDTRSSMLPDTTGTDIFGACWGLP